jgi:hypothetical protein
VGRYRFSEPAMGLMVSSRWQAVCRAMARWPGQGKFGMSEDGERRIPLGLAGGEQLVGHSKP